MAVIQCKNGHYYDSERYAFCPHCGTYEERNSEKTIFLQAEKKGDFDDGQKTIGIFQAEETFCPITGWLVCIGGPKKGKDYRIYVGYNHIGRDIDMDISIPEDSLIELSNHCAIVYDGKNNQFLIVPGMESATYLNQEYLSGPKVIKTGDILEIGKSELEFVAFCREGRKW
ncbi:MAG: FHA domain-containing protein [Lachnospiraceae bacterium]|jgi:hypothetical protein|nr:FHA domain-containing protein [Lachnospiraceae bacterium]